MVVLMKVLVSARFYVGMVCDVSIDRSVNRLLMCPQKAM